MKFRDASPNPPPLLSAPHPLGNFFVWHIDEDGVDDNAPSLTEMTILQM